MHRKIDCRPQCKGNRHHKTGTCREQICLQQIHFSERKEKPSACSYLAISLLFHHAYCMICTSIHCTLFLIIHCGYLLFRIIELAILAYRKSVFCIITSVLVNRWLKVASRNDLIVASHSQVSDSATCGWNHCHKMGFLLECTEVTKTCIFICKSVCIFTLITAPSCHLVTIPTWRPNNFWCRKEWGVGYKIIGCKYWLL